MKIEINRYILLHVIDYTFITNPTRYEELIRAYERKYENRKDFPQLLEKVKPIDEIETFLQTLLSNK